MATKPRITKLDDPANPYGQKRTPTRARTEGEKMEALARSRKAEPAKRPATKPIPAASRVHPVMKRANAEYNAARHKAIDDAVEGRTRRKR